MISDSLENVIESFTFAGITAYFLRLIVEAEEVTNICTQEVM